VSPCAACQRGAVDLSAMGSTQRLLHQQLQLGGAQSPSGTPPTHSLTHTCSLASEPGEQQGQGQGHGQGE